MIIIHLVFRRGFSSLLLLLLFTGHLFLNKHNSCLAIRYYDEPDGIDWDSLVNERPTRYHTNVNEISPVDQMQSDSLRSSQQQDAQESNKIYGNDADTKNAVDTLPDANDNAGVSNPWVVDTATGKVARLQSSIDEKQRRNDVLFLVLVGICSAVGILGLISAAIFWYKIQKRAEEALDTDYPSYGVTGPSSGGSKISPSSTISDRKLAQSAQMFHYQQQRQQMMAQEKAHLETKPVHSDDSDDEAPGGGDYTVYECPGLAPTGEMEVRNPLFSEPDSALTTPAATSHPTTNNHYPQLTTTASPSSSPPKEKFLS